MKQRFLWVTVLLSLGTAGAAADEMTVAPAYFIQKPTPSRPWTGVYVGGNGGYAWGGSTVNYTANDPAAFNGTCGAVGRGTCIPANGYDLKGGLAGGQIGFNWQVNSMWLIGVETDYQWANLTGAAVSPFHLGNVGNTNAILNQTVDSFGTVRVRMGVIPANPLLLYGTGGLAYGRISDNFSIASVGTGALASGSFSYRCIAGGPACFTGTPSNTQLGWTGGAGIEYAISSNFIFRTEFLWVNLGRPSGTMVAQNTVGTATPSSFATGSSSLNFAVVRGGLSFKFW